MALLQDHYRRQQQHRFEEQVIPRHLDSEHQAAITATRPRRHHHLQVHAEERYQTGTSSTVFESHSPIFRKSSLRIYRTLWVLLHPRLRNR